MLTNPPPDDFAQRLLLIRRHLHGLSVEIDRLEQDIQQQRAQPDGERAAQRAREVVYQQGPRETKLIT